MAMEWMNLYDIFVNQVFGSFWYAAFAVLIVMVLIAWITRGTPTLIFFYMLLFFMANLMIGLRILSLVPFILAFVYMFVGIIRFFQQQQ